MAVPYRNWLYMTGRKGTAADALTWKTTHGVALGLYNPDGTRKVAPPPPDLGPPVSPQQSDLRFAPLQAQLQNIPGTYNDERRVGGLRTLKDLIDAGLLDSTSTLGQESKDSGVSVDPANPAAGQLQNVVYHVVRGADGKQYLQGFRDVAGAQNARGFLESSQTDQRQADTKAGYDKSVSDAFLNLGGSQQGSLKQEGSDITGVNSSIGELRGTIAGEQSQKPAPVPAAPAAPGAPPTPGTANLPPTLQTPAAFAKWLAGQGIRNVQGQAFAERYWKARAAHKAPVPGAKF